MNNEGSDAGLAVPMVEQIQERHGKIPDDLLLDGGYLKTAEIIDLTKSGVTV